MSAYAGKAPWYNAISETTKTGRQRSNLSSGNYQWDLSEGWHTKRKAGWKSKGKKSGLVEQVSLTTPDGKTVKVYRTTGYNDTVGFHSHDEPDEDAIDYAMNAFDENDPSHGPIYKQEGCGHIKLIEYAQMQQVLRVTFVTDGAICLFFRVPSAVAGALLSLAKSGVKRISAVDGTERHALGIEFWDLVRVRGQRHGSRYPFEYEKRGVYKLTQSNKRYNVLLSDENIKDVLGGRYYGKELKPGDTISAVLSEEEYARFIKNKHITNQEKLVVQQKTVNDKDSGLGVIETEGVDMDYYSGANTEYTGPGIEGILSPKDYSRYIDLQNKIALATSKAQQDRADELLGKHLNISEEAKRDIWSRVMKEATTNTDLQNSKGKPSMEKITNYVQSLFDQMISGNDDFADKRYKTYHEKASANPARVAVTPHQVFAGDKQALNDYLRITSLLRKSDNHMKYAATFNGRGWTINELIDFSNPTIPGAINVAHADLYKRFIQTHDYEAALNFLKNHKHDIYVNGKVVARNRPYASPHDFIVLDGGI